MEGGALLAAKRSPPAIVLTGGGAPNRRLLPSPRRLHVAPPNKAMRKPPPRDRDSPQTGGKVAAEQPSPRSQPFDVEPAGRFKSLRLLGRGSFDILLRIRWEHPSVAQNWDAAGPIHRDDMELGCSRCLGPRM